MLPCFYVCKNMARLLYNARKDDEATYPSEKEIEEMLEVKQTDKSDDTSTGIAYESKH